MQIYFNRAGGNWTATPNDHYDLLISGQVKGIEAQVLLMLLRYTQGWQGYSGSQNHNGNACYAEVNLPYSAIRDATKSPKNKLTKAVKSLIKKGLVVLVESGGGASRSNRYALNYDRSSWKLGDVPRVKPTAELYKDCRRNTIGDSSDPQVTPTVDRGDLEVPSGGDLEVPPGGDLQVTADPAQSPVSTDVVAPKRNEKKLKENILRILAEAGEDYEFLETLPEIGVRDSITYNEAVWQIDRFLAMGWAPKRLETDTHFDSLSNLLEVHSARNVLMAVHEAFQEVVADNKRFLLEGKSRYGDSIGRNLDKAGEYLTEKVTAKRLEQASKLDREAIGWYRGVYVNLTELFGKLSDGVDERCKKLGKVAARYQDDALINQCFHRVKALVDKGEITEPREFLDELNQVIISERAS